MGKKIFFEVQDVTEEPSEDLNFAIARIHAFSSGWNRHDMTCDVDVLKRTATTIYEKPIVFDFDRKMGDFGGHVKSPYIAGFIVPDSAEFIELEDGRIGLYVTAKIWKRYSERFMRIFSFDKTKKRKVSVEMDLLEAERDDETKLVKMLDFSYTAVAVLGKFIREASPDANIEMLSFSQLDNKEEYFSKYSDLDFVIPEQVRESAKNGLDIRKKFGRGGTSVGVSMAKYLMRTKSASPNVIKKMSKYFSSNYGKEREENSNTWIEWQLWGGDYGCEWAEKLNRDIDNTDKRSIGLYMQEDNMPYKSLGEVNPAIKGIKPPVTLGQANEIAKQADAIGSDEKKNGWAIAINNFKKTHVVKDGKWVKKNKKEDMSFMEDKDKEKEFEQDETQEESENFEQEKPKEEEMTEEMSEEETPSEEEMADEEEEEEESGEEEMSDQEEEKEETYMTTLGESLPMESLYSKFSIDGISLEEISSEEIGQNVAQMFSQIVKSYEDIEKENQRLAKFEKDVLEKQFDFEVQTTLKEIAPYLTPEQINEAKEGSKEFSLEDIDSWKNMVKAIAFSNSSGNKSSNNGFRKIDLPFSGEQNKNKKSNNSLWK